MRYTESVFGCIGEERNLIAYVCQPEIGNPPWMEGGIFFWMKCIIWMNGKSSLRIFMMMYPKGGDFLVGNEYLFEVGGRRKTFEQIKDIPNSYLAIDDEEVGRGNKIPLWLFGFLY